MRKNITAIILSVVFILSSVSPVAAYTYRSDPDRCADSKCNFLCRRDSKYCNVHACSRCGNKKAKDSSMCEDHIKRVADFQKQLRSQGLGDAYVYKTKTSKNSNKYDSGYNSVMDDDDYDLDRYSWDDDYAAGVDDALDELGEDW